MLKAMLVKMLASKLLKGKLTTGGVGIGLIIPVLEAFGIADASNEVTAIVSGVAAVIVLFGKARAVYQAAKGI